MYEESSCYDDPNAMVSQSEGVMSATQTHNHNHNNNTAFAYSYSSGEDAANANANAAIAMEIIAEHPQQNQYNYSNTPLENHHQLPYPTPTVPDLLNLLHFPNPIPGDNSTNVSSVSYDPYLHLNLQQQQQQPTLRDLLPHMPALSNDFPFAGHAVEGEGIQGFGNGVVDFTQDVGKKRGGKRTKQFTSTITEKQRRVDLSSKFDALKELIPNPSKVIIIRFKYRGVMSDEWKELSLLGGKKRHDIQRVMMRRRHEGEADEGDFSNLQEPDQYSENLRSSWIRRKSKDTEVDVRIVDNEVTIKLVQRKKIDCLVHVSHLLDQLNLDLQHVAGGHIGDFCSYLFNTKICEGSSLYASAIAHKLIQVMDTSFAAASLA
ncbi:transcription factor bHLH91 [Glycine max]|uniref:transcription factor bHLH91 n=1 Tax=Glycine max TaxID=3847 RepID=UPI001B357CB7|nr:transcription factor bHLH91 [Glycine max]